MCAQIFFSFEKTLAKANLFLDSLNICGGDPEKSQHDYFEANKRLLREKFMNNKLKSYKTESSNSVSSKLCLTSSPLFLHRKKTKTMAQSATFSKKQKDRELNEKYNLSALHFNFEHDEEETNDSDAKNELSSESSLKKIEWGEKKLLPMISEDTFFF